MPVYCNTLSIQKDSETTLRNEVAAWLNKKAAARGRYTADNLFTEGQDDYGKLTIITTPAAEHEPTTVSIVVQHPDFSVAGRRWTTEIGIQRRDDDVLFTILLEYSDLSTKVTTDNPPQTTVPGIVPKIAGSCRLNPSTIGTKVKTLTADHNTVEALRHILEEPTRRHPYIICSNDADGIPSIDVDRLQAQLVGIAQVVRIPVDADTRWLAEQLGSHVIPYLGAITIIRIPTRKRRTTKELAFLYLKSRIDDLRAKHQADGGRWPDPVASMLIESVVFHSNGMAIRAHISPAQVRVKQQRDARMSLRERNDREIAQIVRRAAEIQRDNNAATASQAELLRLQEQYQEERALMDMEIEAQQERVEELTKRIAYLDSLIDDTDGEIEDLKQRLLKADAMAEQFRTALTEARAVGEGVDNETRYALQDIIRSADGPNRLTPAKCLRLLALAYPERVLVLPEAYGTAEQSSDYQKPAVLLDMLSRLATKYIDAMLAGGDSKARECFTKDEYAATESETVMAKQTLRRLREITYKGQTEVMERHLRNGVENSTTHSIRVYFLWDADDQKVVIGYCGPHLPTAKRHK